jgi:hypothetical protein
MKKELVKWLIFFIMLAIVVIPDVWLLEKLHMPRLCGLIFNVFIGMILMLISAEITEKIFK